MNRVDALSAAAFMTGLTLLLSTIPRFNRLPLHKRVAPYLPRRSGGPSPVARRRLGPVPASGSRSAFDAVLSPLATTLGDWLGRLTGVRSALEERLVAAGRDQDSGTFRMQQFTGALIGLGTALAVVIMLRPQPAIAVSILVGVPLLVALSFEQRLENDAQLRRERLDAELPVIAEQVAVLLTAGLSLGAALDRVAARGSGVAAADIAVVKRQVRGGTPEAEALRAWSDRTRSEAVERLVGVLAMHRDASDIGALLSTEARSMRAAAHRRLIESIERRSQLVWIPVTVATLVPGLILIGVPFVSAMSRITG